MPTESIREALADQAPDSSRARSCFEQGGLMFWLPMIQSCMLA